MREILIRLEDELYEQCKTTELTEENEGFDFHIIKSVANGIPLPKINGRKFEEIVIEYPTAELCTYPEYKGKPYFSIKYEENGQHIIGYGTYNPEVLSRYLREYFIADSIQDSIWRCCIEDK